MATGDFDLYYGADPWSDLANNERRYYDPMLRDIYRKKNVFGQFSNFQQNLANRKAKNMTITSLYDIHPNTDPIGVRDLWGTASHIDNRQVEVTFNRYYGKVAYNKYDDLITYWDDNGGNGSAVRRIVNDKLGQNMTEVIDLLGRNAYLNLPYQRFGGSSTNFSTLATGDKVTTELLDDVHLGMQYRDVPYAQSSDGTVDNIVCITTPGVYYDLQRQSDPKDWIARVQYADASRLLNYEVGAFRNIRWIVTPKATLYNCGSITYQTTVVSAIEAGDGAPDPTSTKVDNTWMVGQPGISATHYIQLASGADMTQYSVNDIITIHRTRGNTYGVTNGVLFSEGTITNRRLVAIDSTNKRLSFDMPIMIDFKTDLGSGVYAYVTKATHVHSSIFIGGPDAIAVGVGRPVEFHAPAPNDDFNSQYRFSWDTFMGWQNFNPSCAEVLFTTGTYRGVGSKVDG